MPKDYWDQHIAERYDETAADKFSREVVGPAVDFLADLAGDGHALVDRNFLNARRTTTKPPPYRVEN